MNISYIFPQAIFIDNVKTKQQVVKDFNLQGVRAEQLQVNSWFMPFEKREYIVKPMDTFLTIAQKFGVSEKYVASCAKTKRTFIGQKIYL